MNEGRLQNRSVLTQMLEVNNKKYPLIGKVVATTEDSVHIKRKLSLETDSFLDDHRFNNIPFLPGIMGLELFAELGKLMYPTEDINRIENIDFASAIRLKGDVDKTILAKIRCSEDKCAITKIETIPATKTEPAASEKRKLHFSAKLFFGERATESKKRPTLKKMPLLTKEYIYQILPHGKLFHVLSEINQTTDEVIAIGSFKKRRFFNHKRYNLILNPLPIEAGFQAMGLLDFMLAGRAGLPSKIGKLEFMEYKKKPFYIVGRKKDQDNSGSVFDFEVLTRQGEVVIRVTDYRTILVNMGDISGIRRRLCAHQIRQLFAIPRFCWLESVDRALFRDKLSREPDFAHSFLRPEELEYIEKADEPDELLVTFFGLKRVLKIMNRTKDSKQFKITEDDTSGYYCKHNNKRFYLTVESSKEYLLVMAGLKKKVGIALLHKDNESLPTLDVLTEAEIKQFATTAEEKQKLLKKLALGKLAAIKLLGEKANLNPKKIVITNYQSNELKLILNLEGIKSIKSNIPFLRRKRKLIHLKCVIGENHEYLSATATLS